MSKSVKTGTRATKGRRTAGAAPSVLPLPGECTIAEARSLRDRLGKLIDLEKDVTLDRTAVERIDTATVQLLATFVRDRRSRNLAVTCTGDAPAFSDAAELLGLSSCFER